MTKKSELQPAANKGGMVKRTEQPICAPDRDALDSLLAAETDAGRRLRRVSIQNGQLILEGKDEAQQRVHGAFGSESREFETYCLAKLVALLPDAANKDDYTLPINSAIAMLTAIGPRNELEAMLAVQMIASDHMAHLCMRRTKVAQTTDSLQMNGNLAMKFSRTFTAQLEALDRHRRGGKQIVEHVHVNAGGQAVIAGTISNGRGQGGE